jgi:hypothetical protein
MWRVVLLATCVLVTAETKYDLLGTVYTEDVKTELGIPFFQNETFTRKESSQRAYEWFVFGVHDGGIPEIPINRKLLFKT